MLSLRNCPGASAALGRMCERVFEPAYNDMLADYVEARKYRTKWAKGWLAFCFTLRTVFMVAQSFAECFRAVATDKTIATSCF
jgi:hypothetical protein